MKERGFQKNFHFPGSIFSWNRHCAWKTQTVVIDMKYDLANKNKFSNVAIETFYQYLEDPELKICWRIMYMFRDQYIWVVIFPIT